MKNIPGDARHSGWLQKVLIAIALIEVTYLVLINVALSLPVTQTLVNRIKPEKFIVHWEQAWSWYPFRVHARGISANGQTSSQQWQVDTPAASASIDILPLLWRTVKVSNVAALDIEYFQRPRPRADKDYAAIRQYFPSIRDRAVDTTVPVRPPKKTATGWKVVVADAHASGQHHVWVYQLQSSLSGTLQTDVNYQSRGGPFSLSNGKADVELDSLLINNDLMLLREAQIKGTIEFTPFVPSENRGLKSLAYLHVDADIGAQLQDLDFLSFYLNNLYGMNITGAGELAGHARYTAGHLLPQTDLLISARQLALNVDAYKVDGAGDVHISVSDATPDIADVAIRFSDMALLHEEDKLPHFYGEGLELLSRGTSKLFPREGRKVGIDYAT
ncbi:MAG: AsmA family protein, partial [Gammaproteobacteria bacterium]|nr:AsmA family protein [Gammaproteobacteria bacterium]